MTLDDGGFAQELDPDYVHKDLEDLCPICGEIVSIIGLTKDGRLIGSCRDAFSVERWQCKE